MKTLIAILSLFAAPAFAFVESGAPAPDFTATGASGENYTLSEHKGKTVVLEWTNHDCPFVKKFYDVGEMQKMQKAATDEGMVWLRVISSAEGKQGYLTAEQAIAKAAEHNMAATDTLLDPAGELGTLYAAKTTPHMFVIDAKGTLVYQGAIDDTASTNSDDIAGATNYVSAALAAIKAGTTPAVQATKAYGCGVKY
jgi:alkyl hydroperoxide reductase subunit AhpC